MIINTDIYDCPKCEERYYFDTSKPYSKICPICNIEMRFDCNTDCDTELAEKVKNTPPYDPTKDSKSPYYIPVIECPNCHSQRTEKISGGLRVAGAVTFGLFSKTAKSQFRCKSCGYKW